MPTTEFERILRSASNAELIEQYNLIQAKKCNLSRSKRDMLSARVEYMVAKGWLFKLEDGTVSQNNILDGLENSRKNTLSKEMKTE